MYPPYQYQYQYQYNTQYHSGPYSNTPSYNSNNYTRSSANKYHHFQGKNSYSGAIPKRSDDSNSNKNEGIRRASVEGSPSSRDTDSVEMKFDKLNI